MNAIEQPLKEAAPAPMLNTPHARDMLRKRYAPPEWAFMEEVAPKTGGGTRYADGIAVNLWSSRGHAVHGFEIKVSRSDWLRELKQPEKAEDVYAYCDHWWIVAPKGVVKDGELPPTWGLMDLRESGLVISVNAPRLEPKPITRGFFASLMRRGHDGLQASAESMLRIRLDQAKAEIDERIKKEVEYRTSKFEQLKKQVQDFEQGTGLKFSLYGLPPIQQVKAAMALERLSGYRTERHPLGRLIDLAEELKRTRDLVLEATAEFDEIKSTEDSQQPKQEVINER